MIEAEQRGRQWLAQVRRLEEQGVSAGPLYEEADRKSQFWLNRYNALSRTE
ncbi:hypothetical protein [Paracoccus sp. T5]|uniref:hypothetical protein n=1 Tax=Paracoccus sp. T5 TaxID=3402161 RepID=UPI003AE5139C